MTTKCYIVVTHSIIRKSGMFHYIIYRTDNITLFLSFQLRR